MHKKSRIIRILKKSVKWFNWYRKLSKHTSIDLRNANLSSADLRNADLSNANLSSAYLRSADLHSADLRNADLRNANLDFSSGIPFWCGAKNVKVDNQIASQMLLHFLWLECEDKEVKKVQNLKSVQKLASRYKRVVNGEIEL